MEIYVESRITSQTVTSHGHTLSINQSKVLTKPHAGRGEATE